MRPYGTVVDTILFAYLFNGITILWFEVVEFGDWLRLLFFYGFARGNNCSISSRLILVRRVPRLIAGIRPFLMSL